MKREALVALACDHCGRVIPMDRISLSRRWALGLLAMFCSETCKGNPPEPRNAAPPYDYEMEQSP